MRLLEAEDPNFAYSLDSDKAHQAGYDAYITGLAFISLTTYLGRYSRLRNHAEVFRTSNDEVIVRFHFFFLRNMTLFVSDDFFFFFFSWLEIDEGCYFTEKFSKVARGLINNYRVR